ncbi:MAG: hypothetical protein M1835_004671 [Candelina submexicana]|nr:MAG: hypothetical protein M1835_004671 [Candelina submexicana]
MGEYRKGGKRSRLTASSSTTKNEETKPENTEVEEDPFKKLVRVCAVGSMDQLHELLQDPTMLRLALSPKGEGPYHIKDPFLISLICSTRPQKRHQGVPYEALITHETIIAAIKSNKVEVFGTFIEVLPDCVNYDMGKAGDPLTQAIFHHGQLRRQSAYRNDPPSLVAFLLQLGAKISNEPGHHLWEAARSEDIAVVHLLLKHGASVSQTGAVHEAAWKGQVNTLDLLLQHGADVNEQLSVGVGKKGLGMQSPTPLHIAAEWGRVGVVEWLLSHGADAAIKDARGRTPHDVALSQNKFTAWEILTAHNARIDAV